MTVFAYQPHQLDERLPSGARVFSRFSDLHDEFRRAGVLAAAPCS